MVDNDNVSNNNNIRTLSIVPCSSAKTYLMLNKILSVAIKSPKRKLKLLTRSPNEYPDFDIEEVYTIDEYKDYVVVFDDMSKIKQNIFSLFPPAVDMKTMMYDLSQQNFELPLPI